MTPRLLRLDERLEAQGVGSLVLPPGTALRYLTGLDMSPSRRLTLFVHVPGKESILVLPKLEAPGIPETPGLRLVSWIDADGPLAAVREALADVPLDAPVGVDEETTRLWELNALEEAAGKPLQTVPIASLLWQLRSIKDAGELDTMREAGRIVDAALGKVQKALRPGITERQLAKVCAEAILEAGADGLSFNAFVAAGPNAFSPHHVSGDRPIEEGELIIVDMGAMVRGYASDVTRTFAIGEVSPELQRVFDVALASHEAGVAAVRAGAPCEAPDLAARKVILDAEMPDCPHRIGHGLGSTSFPPHEPPNVAEGVKAPLQAGMVVTVEPGVFVPGVAGARVEDAVVVTEDGAERLTHYPRGLLRPIG